MRKLTLFTAALLAGGLLFSGCMFMDHPSPQRSMGSYVSCMGPCNSNTDGHSWENGVMGTAGPPGSVSDLEEGEYWGSVQDLEGQEVVACYWDAGGSSAGTRIDTVHNGTGDEASGCPPFTYQCGWGIWPLGSSGDMCSPGPPYDAANDDLCNIGNGQCVGPIASFANLPGSTWFNYPPNSMDSEEAFICIDLTPGTSPFEGSGNIRRMPGLHCEPCGAGAQALQAPPGKTVVCHVPPGNPANEHTIIVGDPAVPAHLAHGDYLGECRGGGDGEGEQVPDGNNTDWMLGVGYSVDNAPYLLTGKQPFTDDYFSCRGGNCGSSNGALDRIAEVLAANPADENGLVTLEITKLHGNGETIELNPPFVLNLSMEVVNGQAAWAFAVDYAQSDYPTMVRWILDNTPDKKALDGTGMSMELSSGHVVTGTTLMNAVPYELTLNHSRLAQAITDWETLASQSRDLDARVLGR